MYTSFLFTYTKTRAAVALAKILCTKEHILFFSILVKHSRQTQQDSHIIYSIHNTIIYMNVVQLFIAHIRTPGYIFYTLTTQIKETNNNY